MALGQIDAAYMPGVAFKYSFNSFPATAQNAVFFNS